MAAQHRGRDEVKRRRDRLNAVFAAIDGATLAPELLAHYARYLAVLISGYAEQSVKELARQYVRMHADERSYRYVDKQIDRLRNIDLEKLKQLIEAFDGQWWLDLDVAHSDSLQAFSSIAGVRNVVSHGGDAGITVATAKQYFEDISKVLKALCDLLDAK